MVIISTSRIIVIVVSSSSSSGRLYRTRCSIWRRLRSSNSTEAANSVAPKPLQAVWLLDPQIGDPMPNLRQDFRCLNPDRRKHAHLSSSGLRSQDFSGFGFRIGMNSSHPLMSLLKNVREVGQCKYSNYAHKCFRLINVRIVVHSSIHKPSSRVGPKP